MTAEILHDALSRLPMDLVEEADWQRNHPKTRPIRRYVSLAAGLLVVLGCAWFVNGMFHAGAKSTESVAEIPMAAESAQSQATGNRDDAAAVESAPEEREETGAAELYPGIRCLMAVEDAPAGDSAINYQSGATARLFQSGDALPEGIDLPEGWFDDHDLVLLRLAGIPAGTVPQVVSVSQEPEGWYFTVATGEDTAAALTDWYLLMETDKALLPQDAYLSVSIRWD